jgi:hypothetical protein
MKHIEKAFDLWVAENTTNKSVIETIYKEKHIYISFVVFVMQYLIKRTKDETKN